MRASRNPKVVELLTDLWGSLRYDSGKVPLPVRMPLPPAAHQGSIYENQRASGRRYFATPDEAPRIAAE